MPSEYISPLNLETIFVNTFAGSTDIFVGVLFLFMCVGAGIFKMPDRIFMLMIVLAAVMLNQFVGGGIYLLVLLVTGMILFWSISRIVKY